MGRDELAAWLRLTLTPGVGNKTGRNLLAAFGLPQAVFSQSREALLQVVSVAQAKALLTEPDGWADQVATMWDWLLASDDAPDVQRRVVALGDALYPPSLLLTEDPPLLLYLMGKLDEPGADPFASCLAIVGSRNPTPQGQANARNFALACANAGLTVVSGLALGVDGAAHEGALAAEAGAASWATIAVVGTGLDRVYPKQHQPLAHRIAQRGLLVSEYPLGTPPLAENFPRRNRIIAGLSLGTLVVEAALRSGSLITARLAADAGKEVFAIPGSIHAMQSHGCHALIREGAKLVETAQDILEELHLPMASSGTGIPCNETVATDGSAAASRLLQALGHDPVSLDALVARTGIDAAGLQVQLLELELGGDVSRLPGGLFQRLPTA